MMTRLLLISLSALLLQQVARTKGWRKRGNAHGFPGRGRWCLKWCPEGEENEDYQGGSIPYEDYPGTNGPYRERIGVTGPSESGGYEYLSTEGSGLNRYGERRNQNSHRKSFMAPTGMLGRPYGIIEGAYELQSPTFGLENFDDNGIDDEFDGTIPYSIGGGGSPEERYGMMSYGIAPGGVASGLYGRQPHGIIRGVGAEGIVKPTYGLEDFDGEHRANGIDEKIMYGVGRGGHFDELYDMKPDGIAAGAHYEVPAVGEPYQLSGEMPYGAFTGRGANGLAETIPYAEGMLDGQDESVESFHPELEYSIGSAGSHDNSDEPYVISGNKEHETLDIPAKRTNHFRRKLAGLLSRKNKGGVNRRRQGSKDPLISTGGQEERLIGTKSRTHRGGLEDTLFEGGSGVDGLKRKLIHHKREPIKAFTRKGRGLKPSSIPEPEVAPEEISAEDYQDRYNDDEERPEPEHPPKRKHFVRIHTKIRETKAQKNASKIPTPGHSDAKHIRKEPGLKSSHKGSPNKGSPIKTEHSQPAAFTEPPPRKELPTLLGEVADLIDIVLGPVRPPRGIPTKKLAGDSSKPIPAKSEKTNPRKGGRGKQAKSESKNVDAVPDLFDKAIDLHQKSWLKMRAQLP